MKQPQFVFYIEGYGGNFTATICSPTLVKVSGFFIYRNKKQIVEAYFSHDNGKNWKLDYENTILPWCTKITRFGETATDSCKEAILPCILIQLQLNFSIGENAELFHQGVINYHRRLLETAQSTINHANTSIEKLLKEIEEQNKIIIEQTNILNGLDSNWKNNI